MSLATSECTPFTSMIKKWRKLKKQSQLDLSLEAGVSQRHLSFLESGRAKPSREMVLNLAIALELPLRERNQLLNAAGFASIFKERKLDDTEMKAIHHALEISLTHHEPYPAIVADRNWNVVMTNNAAQRFMALIGNLEEVWNKVDPQGDKNIYRMTFHPKGMRPLIRNWDELAKALLLRLQRDVNADPDNPFLGQLLQEMTAISDIDLSVSLTEIATPTTPILPMEISTGGVTLKIFSMISSFGTAQDITAEELKIETFFPADDFTTQFFKHNASQQAHK